MHRILQITPPWKPDIKSDTDTKYIPEEFANDAVQLTPPAAGPLASIDEGDELPYFESFSYHGSSRGGSLGDYLRMSGMDVAGTGATNALINY